MQALVLDTNIVLDVLVFADPAAQPVLPAVQAGSLRWLATAAMRDELARVLTYPLLSPHLVRQALTCTDVLAAFDAHAHQVEAPACADIRCRDSDDQIFIDLAIAHRALLLSKDRQVLSMNKRLQARAARAQRTL